MLFEEEEHKGEKGSTAYGEKPRKLVSLCGLGSGRVALEVPRKQISFVDALILSAELRAGTFSESLNDQALRVNKAATTTISKARNGDWSP